MGHSKIIWFCSATLLLLAASAFGTYRSNWPYMFYYNNGNYYVSHDDVMTGCIAVPHTANGARKSTSNNGGQCAILYARSDCQGPHLQAPSGYDWTFILDEVSSFHLCSWESEYPKPVKDYPPPHKATRITLYDDFVFSKQLAEYTNLHECANLPAHAINKVSSVDTHGNCVRLWEDKECKGEIHEMTPTSLYHRDLSRLRFNNKARSVSPCGGLVPSVVELEQQLGEERIQPEQEVIISRDPDLEPEIKPKNVEKFLPRTRIARKKRDVNIGVNDDRKDKLVLPSGHNYTHI